MRNKMPLVFNKMHGSEITVNKTFDMKAQILATPSLSKMFKLKEWQPVLSVSDVYVLEICYTTLWL